MTDDHGAVGERYTYEAYGKTTITDGGGVPRSQTAISNPLLFTGRRLDNETGFYYFRNRYLNPIEGRFIQRDPIGTWVDRVNLGNAYAYVGNNPVYRNDWSGLFFGAGSAAVAARWFAERAAEWAAEKMIEIIWEGLKDLVTVDPGDEGPTYPPPEPHDAGVPGGQTDDDQNDNDDSDYGETPDAGTTDTSDTPDAGTTDTDDDEDAGTDDTDADDPKDATPSGGTTQTETVTEIMVNSTTNFATTTHILCPLMLVQTGFNSVRGTRNLNSGSQDGFAFTEARLGCPVSQLDIHVPVYQAIRTTGARPLLWTTGLMAPEAYVLKSAIDGWIVNASGDGIRKRAAEQYNNYQRCGMKAALNLFSSGW